MVAVHSTNIGVARAVAGHFDSALAVPWPVGLHLLHLYRSGKREVRSLAQRRGTRSRCKSGAIGTAANATNRDTQTKMISKTAMEKSVKVIAMKAVCAG
jgi:hypothetical protein